MKQKGVSCLLIHAGEDSNPGSTLPETSFVQRKPRRHNKSHHPRSGCRSGQTDGICRNQMCEDQIIQRCRQAPGSKLERPEKFACGLNQHPWTGSQEGGLLLVSTKPRGSNPNHQSKPPTKNCLIGGTMDGPLPKKTPRTSGPFLVHISQGIYVQPENCVPTMKVHGHLEHGECARGESQPGGSKDSPDLACLAWAKTF